MKVVWGRSIGWNMSFNGMGNFKPAGFKPMEKAIITDGAYCYPWRETFVMWPRKSIGSARLFWTKAYKRRVWAVWGTGFHMGHEIQYATLFEILQE